MNIQGQFATNELSVTLRVLIGAIAFGFIIETREIDVIRDAVEESRGLEIDEMCGIVEA